MSDFLLIIDSALYNAIGLSLVTLGVLITIRFLKYPDLTPDGSFTIGACVFARAITTGASGLGAVACGLGAGLLCGALTACFNTKLRIGKLLSSVTVMILSVACAPYILGCATIGLLNRSTLMNSLLEIDERSTHKLFGSGIGFLIHPASIGAGAFLLIILSVALYLFSNTRWGVGVRYLGSSLDSEPIMGTAAGPYKWLALMLGNSLVAAGGILCALTRGGADQGMGLGIVLTGVVALIIGESVMRLIGKKPVLNPAEEIAGALLGTVAYSFIVVIVLYFAGRYIDSRLLTVVMLVLLLAVLHRNKGRESELF